MQVRVPGKAYARRDEVSSSLRTPLRIDRSIAPSENSTAATRAAPVGETLGLNGFENAKYYRKGWLCGSGSGAFRTASGQLETQNVTSRNPSDAIQALFAVAQVAS